jgi:hypothetical protein
VQVLGPADVRRILEVTDSLGIHREAVRVPLPRRGEGAVRVTASSQVEIVAPAGDLGPWLDALPAMLRALDLDAVRRGGPITGR